MTKAQTFSRDALIGTEPSKCMRALQGVDDRRGVAAQSGDDTEAGGVPDREAREPSQ
jgi:hypothetical protein